MASYQIAVIGISCRLDKLDTPEQLADLFRTGGCTVREMPENRRKLIGAAPEERFIRFSYLEDIDKFDNEYFGMTAAESQSTSPEQRILLEMTEQLFRNAGLSRRNMMNTNTAVVMAVGDSGSSHTGSVLSSSAFIGTMNAYCAGRISYYYGLNGPSYTVDATCSSSVVALKQICAMLGSGEAEMGIAGGINLVVDPVSANVEDFMGITSRDGLTRSFDDSAEGTGGAEAAGMLLLKPLEAAQRDGNRVYAVINECELNNDGCRGANIAAPSPEGQAEVIGRVLHKSGISPERIGFVEAHGTATKIGDPIEVQSITKAFSKYTSETQFCALTASKSNIGHAGTAAGMIGVIKAVLQLYHGEVYPICHFRTPNALIDFTSSPLFPCTETIRMDEKRSLGMVNSFGFSGTNSCVLMERYENPKQADRGADTVQQLFSFSDRSADRLRTQLGCFAAYAAGCSEMQMAALARAACSTDEHMEYRAAFCAASKSELLEKLSEAQKADDLHTSGQKCVFLFSGDGFASAEEFAACCKTAESLLDAGITPIGIYGSAGGNFAVKVLKKVISYEDALKEALSVQDRRAVHYAGASKAISNACKDGAVIFIEMGKKGVLGEIAESLGFRVAEAAGLHSCDLAARLYCEGVEMDTERFHADSDLMPMCNYPFVKTSHWNGITAAKQKLDARESKPDYDPSPEHISETIRTLWKELLDTDDFSDDDDFYNVGGSSLMIMQLVHRIKMIYGIETGFEEIDDNATVHDLRVLILEKLKESGTASVSGPVHLEDRAEYPVSYEQRSMLLVSELDHNSDAYKMSAILKTGENTDIECLAQAMRCIVADHLILHTVYENRNGEYLQKPVDSDLFTFEICNETFAEEQAILEFLREKSKLSFRLYDHIPIRCSAAKFDSRYYVLFEMHHIAGDHITVELILSRLLDYYQQLKETGRITRRYHETITYADYAAWQNTLLAGEKGRNMERFWKDYLLSPPDHAVIPYDYDQTDIRGRARSLTCVFSPETSQKVRNCISRLHTTYYVFMLTLYTQLMHRYTLNDDICVGITAFNRTFDGAEEVVGFFANTLVFRDRCNTDISIPEAMNCVKSNLNTLLDNQEMPFASIVEQFAPERNGNEMPFFKNMFTPAMRADGFRNDALQLEVIPADSGSAKFDMLIMPGENAEGEFTLTIEFDTALYADDTIQRFLDNYRRVLEAVCENEELSVGKLEFDDTDYDREEAGYDF